MAETVVSAIFIKNKTMWNFFNQMISDEAEVLKKAISKDAFLVDVRTPAEYENQTVKGTTNIPMEEIPGRMEEFVNKENIVVFCRTGNRSDQVKRFLRQKGIENSWNGGSWQNMEKLIQQMKKN